MGHSALLIELRGALRAIRRSRLAALSVVLCISVGMAAATAVWSVVDHLIVARLPFPQAERLSTVYGTTSRGDQGLLSALNYTDLARDTTQFEALAAATSGGGLLTLAEASVQVTVARVTGSFFDVLRTSALQGRLLHRSDDEADAPSAMVLSEPFWRQQFGGASSVIGTRVRLNGEAYTIVGVARADVRVPWGTRLIDAQMWVPFRPAPAQVQSRRMKALRVIGRLAPEATFETAHAELVGLFDNIARIHPELRGEQVRVVALDEESRRRFRSPLLLLLVTVGALLAIAVTNAACLLLARSTTQEHEASLRSALGAGRWLTMRPVILESLAVVLVGVSLGVALAVWCVQAIALTATTQIPQLEGLAINGRVLAVAGVVAMVIATACAIVPAWRTATVTAIVPGRLGQRATSRLAGSLLRGLVVAELALSLTLALTGALALKGYVALTSKSPGFDPSTILTLKVGFSPDWYPESSVVTRLVEPVLHEIERLPTIGAAAVISAIPYDDWAINATVRYEGRPEVAPTSRPVVEMRAISPAFFSVTRQKLVTGRLFTQADWTDRAPLAVIVNETLVRRDLSDRSPVGHRLQLPDETWASIIGVVSDIRNFGPEDSPRPELYRLFRSERTAGLPMMIRTRGLPPADVAASVLHAIRSVDARVAIAGVRPMQNVIEESKAIGQARFYMTLLLSFGIVGLTLALFGIYGVVGYLVEQRRREFGIRTALGSTRRQILALVLRDGAPLLGLGLLLGLIGGAAVTSLMRSMLYGTDALDQRTWLTATIVVTCTALIALVIPAARAVRVDPLIAIRTE